MFTLGEEQKDIEAQLAEKKTELASARTLLEKTTANLESESKSNSKKINDFRKIAWDVKGKLSAELKPPLDGYHNSKDKFATELIAQMSLKTNKDSLPPIDEIIEEASLAFGEVQKPRELLKRVSLKEISKIEEDTLWRSPLVGSKDVGLSALIEHLNCIGWVGTGRSYLDESNGTCPFCQQNLPSDFEDELGRVFDKKYEDSRAALKSTFMSQHSSLNQEMNALEDLAAEDLAIISALSQLRLALKDNLLLIERKLSDPGSVLLLQATQKIEEDLNIAIDAANAAAREHNRKLNNRENEKARVKALVWQHLVEGELSPLLKSHARDQSAWRKKAEGYGKRIESSKIAVDKLEKQIGLLETRITSVKTTAIGINSRLKAFGFHNFSLEVTPDEKNYRIIRKDQSDAQRTLSEGEKTFITFLYFYHLLDGSQEGSGAGDDRVVVFDDPISSLDSTVMFMVSTLVRKVLGQAGKRNSYIKQVLILTHNAHFYKEVCYARTRNSCIKNDARHWIVRKVDGASCVVDCGKKSPISSSYDLLWKTLREVRAGSTQVDSHTLGNAMRRILENYFKFSGAKWDQSIEDSLSNEDKLVFHSLLSCLHDNSHSIHDDFHITSEASADQYMKVFRTIFEETRHGAHYNLMMEACSKLCGSVAAAKQHIPLPHEISI